MIKRLRWKMVGINMAIVTAVLLTVFASVFFISRAGLARESTLALEEALQTGTYAPLTPGQAAGSRPCFVAVCAIQEFFLHRIFDKHGLCILR